MSLITSRETLHFDNEAEWLAARKKDVTSTESAALFGMSPYTTGFELWHAKRSGVATEFQTNDRVRWGNRLEAAIAQGLADDNGWQIAPMKSYMRLPAERIGSSFDFVILNHPSGKPAHLEIKNVDYLQFRDKWLTDDEVPEAPEHIEMQLQHQMMVSGFSLGYVGALIGGNQSFLIERERDERVIAALRARIAEFWRTIDAGIEPPPVMPEDAAAVIRLNQYAEPNTIFDASTDAIIATLADNYRTAARAEKDAEERKKVAQAEIYARIGNAERVLGNGWTLCASMVADTPPTLITADMVGKQYGGRKGYRQCRLTMNKP
jgi:putative phage-type endonuclease